MPYINTDTYKFHTPLEDVPKERLLVLDNYAFDIDELIIDAAANVQNLYRNPYLVDKDNKEFSFTAKMQIILHPRLQPFAAQYIAPKREGHDSEDEAMAQGEEAYDNYLANRGPDWR